MRFLQIAFIFIITMSVKAQRVKVLGVDLGFPIENVTIYNDTQEIVVYTDKEGMADLSEL